MLAALGVAALTLGVVVLSIFLLGLGTLLKRGACSLRGCGIREGTGGQGAAACEGCPSASQAGTRPSMDV